MAAGLEGQSIALNKKGYLRGYINKRDRPFNEDESYKMVEV